ncbi:MAG: polysaccharide deacetylase family protein [Lentisphaerae bacterium]|nr:polysaccharide deacetylase family protein [Lentisphaerota bacterium]
MSEGHAPALRIDVDFRIGLHRAVPRMAERLAAHNMLATFFLTTQLNGGRPWLRKVVRPGYLKRWLHIGAWRLLGRLGAWGELLGMSGGGDSDVLLGSTIARLLALGHEVGVHGFDHEWWVDEVWHSEPERLAQEVARAYDVMARVTGETQYAWASPGWRSRDDVLQLLATRGVPYLADCWGRAPFQTLLRDGTLLEMPHLPVTVPSAEAMTGRSDRVTATAIAVVCGSSSGQLCCLHDYYEGLLQPGLLDAIIAALEQAGLSTQTLATAATALPGGRVMPRGRLARQSLPGFAGAVSVQEDV